MITRPQQYIDFTENSTAYGIVIRLLDANYDPVVDPGLGEGDGDPIEFTTEVIAQNSLVITESMCEPGSFNVGGVVAASFECVLVMPYEWAELYTEDAVYAEVWFTPQGYEYMYQTVGIRKGQYMFDMERTEDGYAKLSGYDELASDYYNTELTQFDGQVLGSNTSPATTATDALTLVGVSHTIVDAENVVLGRMDFTKDGGFYRCTRRDVIQWVCESVGYFAKIMDGVVECVKTYSNVAQPYVIDKMTGNPWYDVRTKSITGAYIESTDGTVYQSGSDGNCVVVQGNPFFNGYDANNKENCQIRTDALYSVFSGLSYIPFSLNWMGDPALQPGDQIQFDVRTSTGTTTISTRVAHITYTHNGSCTISLDKGEEYKDENDVVSNPTSSSKQYGFNSGDVYSSTFYGYGYTPSGSGYAYIEIPLTKPINASAVTITAGTNMAVRGTTGLMKSGSLADFTIVNTSINAGGFRIQMSGLTTHFTAQTPVAFVGNLTLSFT